MRAVVVGAGGLGSYIGALLSKAGHDVDLVARGAHADAIRSSGLHVETVHGDFEVRAACVESALELGGADLTVVAVKAFSLDEVAVQVAHLAERGSVVVSVLNGVTASERLAAAGCPDDRLVDGIAYMTAFRTAPGRVVRKAAHHSLVVGSSTGAPPSALDTVSEAFDGTGVDIVVADDIQPELWRKMAVVCSLSAICALSGESMGPVRTHRFGAELQRRAIAEVTSVARARGVAMASDAEEHIGSLLDAFPADFYPSVIHDLKRGRRTEMEQLGGVIVALGREVGIEAPLHEAATLAVQLGEARSTG